MASEVIYSHRFIAFIDILGFKDHIGKSIGHPQKAIDVLRALEKIRILMGETRMLNQTIGDDGERVSAFSDSIVVSYPGNGSDDFFFLLLTIARYQLELLAHGYVFRGGISAGQLYHKGSIVFGPALLSAYQLENQHAIHPRIIVEKQVVEEALRLPNFNPPEQEREYIYSLLQDDSDGFYFVDFLRQEQELDYPEDYLQCMATIRQVIVSNLFDKRLSPHVHVKYEWLRNYYNSVVLANPDGFAECDIALIAE